MAKTDEPGVASAADNARRTTAPANVIEALAAVEGEIGGIEKRRGGDGNLQYAFRGIDAISTAVQPLFAKYGVVIVPNVTEYSLNEITVNGKPWTDGTVSVAWTIYGPGGVDDRIEARTVGIGRDNADKNYPKAITQAYKNLLLRLLCIGDPEDDTDGITHERDGRTDEPAVDLSVAQEAATRVSKLSGADKALVTKLAKEAGINNIMRAGDRADELLDIIDNLHAGQPASEPEKEEEH